MQTDLVTVTSHIAHHTAVSSAFTCSSAQQGLYAAASVGRKGLQMYPKGSGWDNRGPCSPPAAVAAAPGLVEGSTRAADGEEFQVSKGFFFFFLVGWVRMNINTTQGCVRVCAVCVYYSILNRIWTVHKAPSYVCIVHIQVDSGEPHALFSSPPDPTSVCMCVSTRVLVCTWYENVYSIWERGKKSHGAVMSHSSSLNSSHMCCVIQVSAHWARSRLFKNTSTMCIGHVMKLSSVRGHHPREWRRGDLSSEPGSVSMKAAGPWGKFLQPSSSILLSLPA